MTRRLVSIAAACGVLALPAGAGAHTGVKSTSPRAGGTASRDLGVGNPRKGGIIEPDQFEELPISVQVPEGEPGSFLTFKAYQTYRGGERVRWTGAPEAEHPAPRVKLLVPATTARRSAGA